MHFICIALCNLVPLENMHSHFQFQSGEKAHWGSDWLSNLTKKLETELKFESSLSFEPISCDDNLLQVIVKLLAHFWELWMTFQQKFTDMCQNFSIFLKFL